MLKRTLLVICLLSLWTLTLTACVPAPSPEASPVVLPLALPTTPPTAIVSAKPTLTTMANEHAVSTAIPSPLPTVLGSVPLPLPTVSDMSSAVQNLVDSFIKARVGEDYFRAHYALNEVQTVAPNLIKATYHYTYEPYVRNYAFTLFITADGQALDSGEITMALLEPQEFVIDPTEAIDLAVKSGAGKGGDNYQVKPLLSQQTRSRFAWQVVNETLLQNQEVNQGRIYIVVLDVENGEVYIQEVLGVSQAH